MTRLELLQLAVGRARREGFDFRRWYTSRLELPWISGPAALALLATQRRYYALIFAHEFAQCFWKPGAEIRFEVAPQAFERTMPDGTVRTVTRKAHLRRSARPNAWRYHLRQMALAEEPLRYLRRFLPVEQEAALEAETPEPASTARTRGPRPLPAELPAFLRRPYRPAPK